MTHEEALRDIIGRQGLKPADYARRLQISPQMLNGRLKQENLSLKLLNGMARSVDYKVVLVPSNERLKDGWYEVE